ncbi:hypothetical protein Tco_0226292 [Tanacetum coccineum]
MLGRQPATGGSDEGTGEIPGVPDELIFVDAKDDNEETKSNSDDIYKYRNNCKEMLTLFYVPSDYGHQFLNLSQNLGEFEQPLEADDDDDDDEGPSAINQGNQQRREKNESLSLLKATTTKRNIQGKRSKGWVLKLDTDNAHMPKVSDTTTWFRPILEEERPASLEPKWVIRLIDLPEAVNNWANAFAKAH